MGDKRRLFMDVRPLGESPDFRRLWLCTGLSAVGSQMTGFAVALQVFDITRSSVAVGAVGLVSAVPGIVFGLLGGSIIDALDRRRIMLLTSVCLAVVSICLAAQSYARVAAVWPLYCLVAVQGLLSSVSAPTSRTFLPRLLPPERMPAGAALNTLAAHGSTTVGPALAGLIAGVWGLKACYAIDALSFAAALYGVARLPAMPPMPEGAAAGEPRPGLSSVIEGLRFTMGHRIVAGALLADMSAMILGMPVALFPAINAAHFGGSPRTLGLLSSGLAIGGVIGSTLSGPVGRISRQGLAMLVAGGLWGLGLIGFGLSEDFWLALTALVLAGTADVFAAVFRTTMVQVATPDRYRGRVSAAEYIVGTATPQLGNFRAGLVGSLTSPGISAISGGLATIVAATLIRFALPTFARYRARPTPEARTDDAEIPTALD